MSTTTQFGTIKAAKDYLVGRIVAEAEREGVSLSKVEHDMLYFTEDGGLSKHMEKVCEEFDREYDNDEYEAKIRSLVRGLQSHHIEEEQEMWDDAVLKLCEGDHYLLVFVGADAPARNPLFSIPKGLRPWLPSVDSARQRPHGDPLRLIVAAVVGGLILMAVEVLIHR